MGRYIVPEIGKAWLDFNKVQRILELCRPDTSQPCSVDLRLPYTHCLVQTTRSDLKPSDCGCLKCRISRNGFVSIRRREDGVKDLSILSGSERSSQPGRSSGGTLYRTPWKVRCHIFIDIWLTVLKNVASPRKMKIWAASSSN